MDSNFLPLSFPFHHIVLAGSCGVGRADGGGVEGIDPRGMSGNGGESFFGLRWSFLFRNLGFGRVYATLTTLALRCDYHVQHMRTYVPSSFRLMGDAKRYVLIFSCFLELLLTVEWCSSTNTHTHTHNHKYDGM
jgi:hypothetical protein